MSLWSVIGKNLVGPVRQKGTAAIAAEARDGVKKSVGQLVDEYIAKHPVRRPGATMSNDSVLAEINLYNTQVYRKESDIRDSIINAYDHYLLPRDQRGLLSP